MKWWRKNLNGRQTRAMAVNASSTYIYDRRRMRDGTLVRAWWRQRSVFGRSWAVLLVDVSSSNTLFLQCKVKGLYGHRLRGVVEKVGSTEIPTGVDLAIWYSDTLYTELQLFYGGRLRNCVLELDVGRSTAAQNVLMIDWRNVKVIAEPPTKWGKY